MLFGWWSNEGIGYEYQLLDGYARFSLPSELK
jgi:hypothetical protein